MHSFRIYPEVLDAWIDLKMVRPGIRKRRFIVKGSNSNFFVKRGT